MSISRRRFLESCVVGAAAMPSALEAALSGGKGGRAPGEAGGGEGGTPDPVFRPLTAAALDTALASSTYGEVNAEVEALDKEVAARLEAADAFHESKGVISNGRRF